MGAELPTVGTHDPSIGNSIGNLTMSLVGKKTAQIKLYGQPTVIFCVVNTAPSLEILGQNYYSGMPFKTLFKCLQRQDPEDFFDVEDFMITRIIPVEIMEFVFVELSIKDIRSCLRTCIRWNHIIHAMFKNKSKSTH